MPRFPCLGWVQGHCGQGLPRAGGAEAVPALPSSAAEPGKQISDPLWDSGKMPPVTLSNSKVHLMGKGAVSSFHSFAACLVWVFLRKNNLLFLKGERVWMA